MANDDFHPADDMAKAFQGLFNGDNIKQAMRDAWDRMKGNTPAAAPKPAEAPPTMNWTPTANAEQQKALDASAAARIRAKAGNMAK